MTRFARKIAIEIGEVQTSARNNAGLVMRIARLRREGAPNSSRGGCAPQKSNRVVPT